MGKDKFGFAEDKAKHKGCQYSSCYKYFHSIKSKVFTKRL